MFTNASGAMAVPEISNKVLELIRAGAKQNEDFGDWWDTLGTEIKYKGTYVDVNVYSDIYSDDDHYHITLYACKPNGDGTYSTDVEDDIGSAVVLDKHAKEFLGIEMEREVRLVEVLGFIADDKLDRDVFMTLFRESINLVDTMSADDCVEVFLGVLKGEQDLTRELLEKLSNEYGTNLEEVLKK